MEKTLYKNIKALFWVTEIALINYIKLQHIKHLTAAFSNLTFMKILIP